MRGFVILRLSSILDSTTLPCVLIETLDCESLGPSAMETFNALNPKPSTPLPLQSCHAMALKYAFGPGFINWNGETRLAPWPGANARAPLFQSHVCDQQTPQAFSSVAYPHECTPTLAFRQAATSRTPLHALGM